MRREGLEDRPVRAAAHVAALTALALFVVAAASAPPARFVALLVLALVAMLYELQRLALLRSGAAARAGLGLALAQALMALFVAAAVFLLFPRSLLEARAPP